MSNTLEIPRNGCALHGALQTAEAVHDLIPVVHSNPGCGVHGHLARRAGGTAAGKGYQIPGTGLMERHIIFGGASRLREQLKNVSKVFEGKTYLVLNSCASAMVGDDVEAMTREAVEQGLPVIASLNAGFHGDVHYGYEHVTLDLFRQLTKPPKQKQDRLVNLLGILPGRDLTAFGDLEELERILTGIGLKVHTFFGTEKGLSQFETASEAALTITCSDWGRLAAEYLSAEYDVPALHLSSVPMGILKVKELVEQVKIRLGLPEEDVGGFLSRETEYFDRYLSFASPLIQKSRYGGPVMIVADVHRAFQYAEFLRIYLGVPVQTIAVTDSFTEDKNLREEKLLRLKKLAAQVYESQDEKEISDLVRHAEISRVLGSSLEQRAARERKLSWMGVSYPDFSGLYLNKSHAGIRGAVSFLEDYLQSL